MATADGLMGVGVPAEVALRTGWTIVNIATADAGQGEGQIIGAGNKLVVAVPDSGGDSVTLPSDAGLCDEIIVHNDDSGVALDVFPATGHSINQLAANVGATVANNTSRRFIKIAATRWMSPHTAAAAT